MGNNFTNLYHLSTVMKDMRDGILKAKSKFYPISESLAQLTVIVHPLFEHF